MKSENDAKLEFLKALNKVQGLIEPAKKDSTNLHFKSKYASLAAVNDAVMGTLTENGFCLLSGGIDLNGKPYLRTVLFHVGGHEESFCYPLIEKTENPQHVASSVTYARRYSICALLNLSVEDDDGNAAANTTHTTAATKPLSQEVPAQKLDDWQVAKFVPVSVVARGEGWDITGPDGAVYGTLNKDKAAIAERACKNGIELSLSYIVKGKFKSIGKIGTNEPVPF